MREKLQALAEQFADDKLTFTQYVKELTKLVDASINPDTPRQDLELIDDLIHLLHQPTYIDPDKIIIMVWDNGRIH